MSDLEEDFWPEYSKTATEDSAPIALLKEQARLLARKTDGRVEGVVKEWAIPVWNPSHVEGSENENPNARSMSYILSLRAPALGDYEYNVLFLYIQLNKGPEDPFPIAVSDGDTSVVVQDMSEFKAWLRKTLSSSSVANVIANLSRRSEKKLSQ